MIEIQDKHKCSGCGACESICPVHAVSMVTDEEGFYYPKVNIEKCINCQKCQKQCPVLKCEQGNSIKIRNIAYAAKTMDEVTLKNSSSGGVFSEIARYVIEHEGVVFGASFDEEFNVQHINIKHIDELTKIQGSKYVQSRIGHTYVEAKKYLDEGKMVFFTGTPCQIAGLYGFLNKKYDNLYTQDIICHGVPSPMIWKKYVEFREEKALVKTRKVSFRDKSFGWKKYAICFEFTDCKKYLKEISEDMYMRGFLKNIDLRPSCYQCSFKNPKRMSDFTLADFWGVEKVCPEMYDEQGTSLVMLNSSKGKKLFELLKDNIIFKEVNFEEAIKYNSAMLLSVKENVLRKEFIKCVSEKGFETAAQKYLELSRKEKMKESMKKLKRKCREYLFS